jgi:glyoxylase-like metal-dependent hydrolase (beta-lactamase superfamily II)
VLDIIVDELHGHAIKEGSRGILVTKTPGHSPAELGDDVRHGESLCLPD